MWHGPFRSAVEISPNLMLFSPRRRNANAGDEPGQARRQGQEEHTGQDQQEKIETEEGRQASKREKRSYWWSFLTSFICIQFYLVFNLRDEGKGRMWSEQERKEIIRMMFPEFFHLHTVLPVIYFTGWRQRKDVKRESEKSDHEGDDSSLLPLSHHSTCYLFYGIEAEIMRMLFPDFFHLHTVLPGIYFTGWRQRKDVKRES